MLLFVFYTLKLRCDLTLVCGGGVLCVKYYCTAVEQKHINHVYDTEQFPFLIEPLKMPLWCKFVCLYVALISNSIPIRAALAMAFAVQRCLWFYSFLLLKYGSKLIVWVWGLI